MTAYLFDLDGTLADTLPLIVESSQLALAELGRRATDEKIISLIGMPLLETGEVLLGPGQGELYRDCYQKHFATLDSSALAAFPGLSELLAALASRGGKLACVTSKRRGPTQRTLAQIGLGQYFSVVVTAEDCERHKPHGEPALTALTQLDATGEKAIFIGDSKFDVGCAHHAGLPCCGVTWGAEDEARLKEAGADWVARTVEELGQILFAELE